MQITLPPSSAHHWAFAIVCGSPTVPRRRVHHTRPGRSRPSSSSSCLQSPFRPRLTYSGCITPRCLSPWSHRAPPPPPPLAPVTRCHCSYFTHPDRSREKKPSPSHFPHTLSCLVANDIIYLDGKMTARVIACWMGPSRCNFWTMIAWDILKMLSKCSYFNPNLFKPSFFGK